MTNGHFHVITGAADLFDELHVVIAVNPAKKSFLSAQERKELIERALDLAYPDGHHVHVHVVVGELTVRWAETVDAGWHVRGLRNTIDFEYENALLEANRHINPEVKTIFIPAASGAVCESSSFVKGFLGVNGGCEQLSHYVNEDVAIALQRQYVQNKLRVRFHGLWKRMNATTDADEVFDSIWRRWNELHRHYHTWQHLDEVLGHFDSVRHLCEYSDDTEFALWVHDLFEEIRSPDNEVNTITESQRICSEAGFSGLVSCRVSRMIQVLSHSDENLPSCIDEKCAADCDLAILGQPADRFVEYCAQIRSEYAAVSLERFVHGRMAVLERFQEREVLYHTDVMRNSHAYAASENLKEEIARLRGIVVSFGQARPR